MKRILIGASLAALAALLASRNTITGRSSRHPAERRRRPLRKRPGPWRYAWAKRHAGPTWNAWSARNASGAAARPGSSHQAFAAAAQKMHKAMAIAFTGNADADFVRGMIPHHQGAIDMARRSFWRMVATRPSGSSRTRSSPRSARRSPTCRPGCSATRLLPAQPNAKQVIEAYEEINEQMHADMGVPLTGNADADFMQA